MRGFQVKIIIRPIEIGRHRADKASSILSVVHLAQLQAAERNEVERLVRILTGMIAQDSEFIARNLAILVEL